MSGGSNWILENMVEWIKIYIEYCDTPWWKISKKIKLKHTVEHFYPVVRAQILNFTKENEQK